MRKIWKPLLGALAAVLVLDGFSFFYYNPPSHLASGNGATDTIRRPGAFTCRATEGFAWAKMDENGYNNPSLPGEDGVSVLMMGSSHAEGLNVLQSQNASFLLNRALASAGQEGMVYNIGISSHQLARNAANLSRALAAYRPKRAVVIETSSVVLTATQIEWILTDTYPKLQATTTALPGWISDRPLVRALYQQWNAAHGGEERDVLPEEITPDMLARYEDALTELFLHLKETADEYGVPLVIYYHPHLLLNPDGSATADTNEACLSAFSGACRRAGIGFIDMTERFLAAYREDAVLPHGFFNTRPGTGHLNPAGQAMVADALYDWITKEDTP